MKSTDYQVAGRPYQKLKIQTIEYILATTMPLFEGAIVKYIYRWKETGGVEA